MILQNSVAVPQLGLHDFLGVDSEALHGNITERAPLQKKQMKF